MSRVIDTGGDRRFVLPQRVDTKGHMSSASAPDKSTLIPVPRTAL